MNYKGRTQFPLATAAYVAGEFGADRAPVRIWFSKWQFRNTKSSHNCKYTEMWFQPNNSAGLCDKSNEKKTGVYTVLTWFYIFLDIENLQH